MFMIISEQERSRIKSLYGLLTESAPPNESVLVANKNPFKYSEYESAQRIYESSLNDGDMFFTINPTIKEYLKSIFLPTYKSFIGKTIRIVNKDQILKVDGYTYPMDISLSSGYSTKVTPFSDLYILFKYMINGTLYPASYKPSSDRIGLPEIGGFGNNSPFTKSDPEISNFLLQVGESIKSVYMDRLSNIQEIPDEYFEIRKIERQKTDF
jgi:hypothetical protein